MNVKGSLEEERFRDPERSPITSFDESSLTYLLEIAEMADKMKSPGNSRYKQLQLILRLLFLIRAEE